MGRFVGKGVGTGVGLGVGFGVGLGVGLGVGGFVGGSVGRVAASTITIVCPSQRSLSAPSVGFRIISLHVVAPKPK